MSHLIMLQQVVRSLFLGLASDLSDQNDPFGVLVLQEDFQAVDEIGAVEGVTANAHAQRLAETDFGRLIDSLIGQGSRA